MSKKIAVITPYYKEPIEILRQCHESVASQDIKADHFFVADGFPNKDLLEHDIKHLSLPNSHDDNGNTPRGIGSILADSEGYDFISYLDADNWFHPNHLSSLLASWQSTNADVICSFRTLHHLDGTELMCDQDPDEIALAHVDTSCFLLHRTAFDAANMWLKMPKMLSPICDRIFYAGLKHKNYRFAFSGQKTLAFRSQYEDHYRRANVTPPPNIKRWIGREQLNWLVSLEGVIETTKKMGFYPISG